MMSEKKMSEKKKSLAQKGGEARAQKLSPERRREIAKKAAAARWQKDFPVAEWSGTLEIGEMEFPCAVLSDGTRVLTETDFMKTMGIYRSGALSVRREDAGDDGGARMPLSLAFKNLKPFIDRHLGDVHEPLSFRTLSGNVSTGGIPAEVIPKICEIWIDADRAGVLGPTQQEIAKKADILLRGLAHVGIIALVDEATGFQAERARDELAKILQAFVQDELRKWVRTFPPEFYEQLHRLRDMEFPKNGRTRRPQFFGHLTNDIVYKRLAPGVKDELKRITPRDNKGRHKHKLFQRLTEDVGHPRLREHLASVIALMRISEDYEEFERHLDRALPRWDDTLPLGLPEC